MFLMSLENLILSQNTTFKYIYNSAMHTFTHVGYLFDLQNTKLELHLRNKAFRKSLLGVLTGVIIM